MTGTLQHAQIGAPRTDCVAILVGHHAGQLMHMSKIVNGPGRQKLRERYHSQRRMPSSPAKSGRRGNFLMISANSGAIRGRYSL